LAEASELQVRGKVSRAGMEGIDGRMLAKPALCKRRIMSADTVSAKAGLIDLRFLTRVEHIFNKEYDKRLRGGLQGVQFIQEAINKCLGLIKLVERSICGTWVRARRRLLPVP
jgi:hypothetical protein